MIFVLTFSLSGLILVQSSLKCDLQINCSTSVFEMMVDRLLQAPINLYYDITPTSRIMGLFMFELKGVQISIFEVFTGFIQFCVQILISVVMTVYLMP